MTVLEEIEVIEQLGVAQCLRIKPSQHVLPPRELENSQPVESTAELTDAEPTSLGLVLSPGRDDDSPGIRWHLDSSRLCWHKGSND